MLMYAGKKVGLSHACRDDGEWRTLGARRPDVAQRLALCADLVLGPKRGIEAGRKDDAVYLDKVALERRDARRGD